MFDVAPRCDGPERATLTANAETIKSRRQINKPRRGVKITSDPTSRRRERRQRSAASPTPVVTGLIPDNAPDGLAVVQRQ